MTKKELLKHNPPHRMIVDLYKDDDEIPNGGIKALYYTPKPQPYIILTSVEGMRLLEEALKEYYEQV